MILRSIPTTPKKIYLTFDDGPDPVGTPAVLDLLKRTGARATFFVIAKRLADHPDLVRRILDEGHALGNHSWDHRYGIFFAPPARIGEWVDIAQLEFSKLGAAGRSVGFRPPAGVVTPRLRQVLGDRGIPLILWNERFFDSVWPWPQWLARRSAARLGGGSIVLLHDSRRRLMATHFERTLEIYVRDLAARGFELATLNHI